jgi:uncharacterized protein
VLLVRRLIPIAALLFWFGARPAAQLRLADDSDRAAFRSWFVLLADAQFERPAADVADCAALVRHAFREALRAHTPEWVRRSALPFAPTFADVRSAPRAGPEGWPLFRVSDSATPAYAEFADARTIVRFNTRPLGKSLAAAQPGDLIYFRQAGQAEPDHLMVFVGRSFFENDGDDWVVYHTGPSEGRAGEVRKLRLATLLEHPAPRWRPTPSNPNFIGLFRLAPL